MTNQKRIAQGAPTGGQFATETRAEPDLSLTTDAQTAPKPPDVVDGRMQVDVDPRDGSTVITAPSHNGGRCVSRGRPWQASAPETYDLDSNGVSSSLMLHDGPDGEAAVRYIRADGTTSSITHYRDGLMRDTIDYDRAGDIVVRFACDECGHTPCTCSTADPTEPSSTKPATPQHQSGAAR